MHGTAAVNDAVAGTAKEGMIPMDKLDLYDISLESVAKKINEIVDILNDIQIAG